MSVVIPQIIHIYLLSMKFVEIKGDSWHPGNVFAERFTYGEHQRYVLDVQKYSVWKKDAKTSD